MVGITSRLAGGGLDVVGLVHVGALGLLGGGDLLDLGGGGLLLGAGLGAAGLLGLDQLHEGGGVGVEDLLGGLQQTPLRSPHLGVEAHESVTGEQLRHEPVAEPQVALDDLGQVDLVQGTGLGGAERVGHPVDQDRDLQRLHLQGTTLRQAAEQEVVGLLVLVAGAQVGLAVLREPGVELLHVLGPVALELPATLVGTLGRDAEFDGRPAGGDRTDGERVGLFDESVVPHALAEALDGLGELAGGRRLDGPLARLTSPLVGVLDGGRKGKGRGGHDGHSRLHAGRAGLV